jgi:predicted nucleotidyltransferase component of viral defense system
MIEKDEIILFSKKLKLDPSIVEKDYVLGWILNGIYNNPKTCNTWIFKGGTSLKKCYFDNYRFSEDLDFSLHATDHEDHSKWRPLIAEISDWVNAQSGIDIPSKFIDVDIYKSPQGRNMIQASIRFNGPLRRKTNFPRIKLDLSPNEKIVLKPEKRPIHHPYSDILKDEAAANCYPYDEIFAEKIRALAERARSRDLYDVVHLYRARNRIKSKKQLLAILTEKCQHKNIPLPDLETIQAHSRNTTSTEWQIMLNHQLPELEPYENYWSEIPDFFAWLYSTKE